MGTAPSSTPPLRLRRGRRRMVGLVSFFLLEVSLFLRLTLAFHHTNTMGRTRRVSVLIHSLLTAVISLRDRDTRRMVIVQSCAPGSGLPSQSKCAGLERTTTANTRSSTPALPVAFTLVAGDRPAVCKAARCAPHGASTCRQVALPPYERGDTCQLIRPLRGSRRQLCCLRAGWRGVAPCLDRHGGPTERGRR
jgi:hypothetical protein